MNPFNDVPDEQLYPVLPIENSRGNTSLANIYNNKTTQLKPFIKMIDNPENYDTSSKITKNANSYTEKGSLEDIFKSMGIVDNTFDPESPAFKDGAIQIAYIRLIISGRIQYRKKSAFLNTIIGENYTVHKPLNEMQQKKFENILTLIDDSSVLDLSVKENLRGMISQLMLVISSLGLGHAVYHGLSTISISATAVAATAGAAGDALLMFPMLSSAFVVIVMIFVTANAGVISPDYKKLITSVLIKLLDTFLISSESLMHALASERIEGFPLLYKDPNSRAIYYKYVNELSKMYEKKVKKMYESDDTGEHMKLSNFVSNDNCTICLGPLAQPLTKTIEICSNHHSFHMLCIQEHIKEHNKCPLCREVLTKDIIKEIKDYKLLNDVKRGGSRKKRHTRNLKRRNQRK